uniref:Uncharacterized protein n=1 Tax=Ananas comosus var. bracteatus TaxID=296719 RepID=A0A6V7PMX5_ANACO|nr:unnamed protein product [Ananas comosus var. bracteatus]
MASKQQRIADGDGPLPREGGPSAKRARSEAVQPFPSPLRVELNPADCDLDFEVGEDGLRGHALHEEGFAYCWSGARASVGMTAGKYCFGCKIISEQVVDMADTPSDQQHLCRVGISRGADPVGTLERLTIALDLAGPANSRTRATFRTTWLGIAQHFDATSRGLGMVDAPLRTLPWESALFPHVLLKNVAVQLQFTLEDGLVPEDGKLGERSSGERYILLGTNLALDQMKVCSRLLRKNNYGERFERLMNRATGIFNTLLARAAKTPRNYIIDQKCSSCHIPTTNELKFRSEKRFKEMGKEVPAEAINEMIANYVLPMKKSMPNSNEVFDEVIFPDSIQSVSNRSVVSKEAASVPGDQCPSSQHIVLLRVVIPQVISKLIQHIHGLVLQVIP